MRGWWVVAGGIGLVSVAYAADRWLRVIEMNVAIYGSAEGWDELGLVVALGGRAILLVGLVAVFMAVSTRPSGWGPAILGGAGVLLGVLAALVLGIGLALDRPLVTLTDATEPFLLASAVFLPWTAMGLLAIAVVARWSPAIRRVRPGSTVLVGAAIVVLVGTYLLDALFEALTIDLASTADAYPAWAGLGVVNRVVVMGAFALVLAGAAAGAIGRPAGMVLVGIGLIGFVVLPLVQLVSGPSPQPPDFTPAGALDPGTAGRWMAGAMSVAGAVALAWPGRRAAARTPVEPEAARASPA